MCSHLKLEQKNLQVFEIPVNTCMRKLSSSTKSKAGYLKTNVQKMKGKENRIEHMEREEERKGKGQKRRKKGFEKPGKATLKKKVSCIIQ